MFYCTALYVAMLLYADHRRGVYRAYYVCNYIHTYYLLELDQRSTLATYIRTAVGMSPIFLCF